jgi:hypothetical protein
MKCALRIFITYKNPQSKAGQEPATESPVGSVAGTLTARPPRATLMIDCGILTCVLTFLQAKDLL